MRWVQPIGSAAFNASVIPPRGLHLDNQSFHALLGLFVQVGKVCPEFTGQNQIVEPDGVVFLKAVPMHTAPFTDGAGFILQLQVRDEVVPGANVIDIHGQASSACFVPPFYRSVLLLSNLSQRKNCAFTSFKMQAQIPYFTRK